MSAGFWRRRLTTWSYDIEEFEDACGRGGDIIYTPTRALWGFWFDTTVWNDAFMLGEDFDVTTVLKTA